jgi:anti-sigma-K factor RskA
MGEMGCAGFAGMAEELALGVLTGRERAEALAHLDRCAACRADVRRLTVAAGELLRLLPAREPPPGFETRVLERLGLAGPGPVPGSQPGLAGGGRPGRARRVLAAAAVALAVAVSATGGWGLGAAVSSPAGPLLRSAALVSASHQAAGAVFYFYGGGRQWLSMSVSLHRGTGAVTCQLVSRDGHVTTLGSFWLDGGYGAWASPGPVSDGQFTSARLVAPDGTVLATASLPRS